MVKTIGPVFQSYAPGLGLLDLAVGVAGAVILYFVVQSKIKKARKFRRDMEYGSARWGTEADIKPFVDPKFENNVILTGTEFLTMNTRPKIPANARNLNACVIGSSGSGKTRFWLTPQLLQAHSSYVVVDPRPVNTAKSFLRSMRRILSFTGRPALTSSAFWTAASSPRWTHSKRKAASWPSRKRSSTPSTVRPRRICRRSRPSRPTLTICWATRSRAERRNRSVRDCDA